MGRANHRHFKETKKVIELAETEIWKFDAENEGRLDWVHYLMRKFVEDFYFFEEYGYWPSWYPDPDTVKKLNEGWTWDEEQLEMEWEE